MIEKITPIVNGILYKVMKSNYCNRIICTSWFKLPSIENFTNYDRGAEILRQTQKDPEEFRVPTKYWKSKGICMIEDFQDVTVAIHDNDQSGDDEIKALRRAFLNFPAELIPQMVAKIYDDFMLCESVNRGVPIFFEFFLKFV